MNIGRIRGLGYWQLVFALAASLPLSAETRQCPDPLFRVSSDDPGILTRTCRIAAQAREKLAACSVPLARQIEIRVRDRVVGEIGECFGIYHCGDDAIEILSPDAMTRSRAAEGAFSSVSDETFWESVIVHEITHAAYDPVPCPFPSCMATSEYASYAMQVWTLPEKDKDRFGTDIALRIEPTGEAINSTILLMSPDRFSVIAWRHFQTLAEPCMFMGKIMQGEVYFDYEPL